MYLAGALVTFSIGGRAERHFGAKWPGPLPGRQRNVSIAILPGGLVVWGVQLRKPVVG